MDRWSHRLFGVIMAAYLVIGGLYASITPAWQAPDEPAHYNYVRALVEQRRLPVLIDGCYDQAYLSGLLANHFPPQLPVAGLCYEFHQPPLYYLLSAPVFALTGGSLLALRLVSVAWGGVLLWLAYRLAGAVFPDQPAISLGTAAFVAFVPMHAAMLAAVNNDALAEVLLTALLLLLVRSPGLAGRGRTDPPSPRTLLPLGLVLGLGLLTKTTVYIGVPLLAVGLWLGDPRPRAWLKQASLAFLPALLIALPWYLRNARVYGGFDILGLRRHDAIVAGQLRTADHLAAIGPGRYLFDFARVTFDSFWGQFGWMAVPIDSRLYLALALASLLAAGGLALWIRRTPALLSPAQIQALRLLGLAVIFLGLGYLWYNSQFVQFQGRYFFAAIAPLGLFFTLGLREALGVRWAAWAAGGLLLLTAGIAAGSLLAGDVNGWGILIGGAFAALLAARRWLPERAGGWLALLYYLGLAGLSASSPFLFVAPYL